MNRLRRASAPLVLLALVVVTAQGTLAQVAPGRRALRAANGRPDTFVVWGPTLFQHSGAGTWTYFNPDSLYATAVDSGKRYLLRVTNGTSGGSQRVAELKVSLNGKEQLVASDVTTGIHQTSRVIRPGLANSVTTGLRGVAGDQVVLDVISIPAPQYTIAGPDQFTYTVEDPESHPLYLQFEGGFARPSTAAAPWILEMVNGDTTTNTHNCSAALWLNGTQVVSQSQFGSGTRTLSKQVALLSSTNTYMIRVYGTADGDYVTVRFTASDTTAPVIQFKSPAADTAVFASTVAIAGNVLDETIGKGSYSGSGFDTPGAFKDTIALEPSGWTTIAMSVSNAAGYRSDVTRRVLRDPTGPAVVVTSPPQNHVTSSASATVTGTWLAQVSTRVAVNGKQVGTPGATGSFNESIALSLGANAISVTAIDTAGQFRSTVHNVIRDPLGPGVPEPIAPAIDLTRLDSLRSRVAFLWTGPNPVQTASDPAQLERSRIAVLRGRVVHAVGTSDLVPMPHVSVKVAGHPEYGQSVTRASGRFELAVNGGGDLTLEFSRTGFLGAQRTVNVPFRDFVHMDDVALRAHDLRQTPMTLNSSDTQVARASVVREGTMTRQATVVMDPNTTAQMILPDGSLTALSGSPSMRMTEYTVGPLGAVLMPAALPTFSGYTYCAELSLREADSLGGRGVVFSKPVAFYLENFLDAPVGTACPVGRFEPDTMRWKALPDGRVIKLLADSAATFATVDADGDGNADTADSLMALGIDLEERRKLADLYSPNQSLWRVQLTHFSTVDINWAFALPPDARAPDGGDPEERNRSINDCCIESGSQIDVENRALRESLPLVGTPMRMHYSSERTRGNLDAYTLRIPLRSASLPSSVARVRVDIDVEGQRTTQEYSRADTPEELMWTWDGRDGFGRLVQGRREARVRIGYQYPNFAIVAPRSGSSSFAAPAVPGSARFGLAAGRTAGIVWAEWKVPLGAVTNEVAALGGWSLSEHHFYDFSGRGTLYLGDGRRMNGERQSPMLKRLAGQNFPNSGSCPNAITGGYVPDVIAMDLAAGPDGSLYFVDQRRKEILRLDAGGYVHRVAGNCGGGDSNTDDIIATEARLELNDDGRRTGIAVAPDSSIYVAESNARRIRRIYRDGSNWRIRTIAGNPSAPVEATGDGGPAIAAHFKNPTSIAAGPDGSLYVYDYDQGHIRHIGRDGIIRRIAGNVRGFVSDTGSALLAGFSQANNAHVGRMTVMRDGSLVIADQTNDRIRKITGDGRVQTIANIFSPASVAAGPGDELYVTTFDERLLRVDPSGVVSPIAGVPNSGAFQHNHTAIFNDFAQQARTAGFRGLHDVEVMPDGTVVLSEIGRFTQNGGIPGLFAIQPVMPGFGPQEFVVADETGSEQYVFDGSGRHLRTLDATTGAVRYRFGYTNGLLTTVTDANTDVLTITRDGSGTPTQIVAPYNQVTTVSTVSGPTGRVLSGVTNPADERWTVMANLTTGQMTRLRTPRGHDHVYTMSEGRLVTDAAPDGRSVTLSSIGPSDTDTTRTIRTTSAAGRIASHTVTFDRSSGRESRRRTDSFGVQSSSDRDGAEAVTSALADGSELRMAVKPDIRIGFGMQSPVVDTLRFERPVDGAHAVVRTVRSPATVSGYQDLTTTTTVSGPDFATRTSTVAYDRQTSKHVLLLTPASGAARRVTVYVDSVGRDSVVERPGLAKTTVEYDTRGRVERVTVGTRVWDHQYDAAGRLQKITDPLSRETTFGYDAADRVTSQVLPGEPGEASTVAYAYDADGALVSLTPPGGQAHTFARTPAGLVRHHDPPGVSGLLADTTGYARDADRLLTRVARADSEVVRLAYGTATGALDTVSQVSANVQTRYGYSGLGQLSQLERTGASASVLTYEHDGPVVTRERWQGAVAGEVRQTYDGALWPLVQTVEGTGGGTSAADYGYDPDGLVTSVAVAGATYSVSRDAATGLVSGTSVGGVATTQHWNAHGELDSMRTVRAGETLHAARYDRDALGRIVRIRERHLGVETDRGVHHDARGRLVAVRDSAGHTELERYTYDANGNRLTKRLGAGAVVTSTYDAQDRQVSEGDTTYGYSAHGERRVRGGAGPWQQLTYDALGSLLNVRSATDSVVYGVDGRGRRITRKQGTTPTHRWLYQGPRALVAELDGSDVLRRRCVYASRAHVPDLMVVKGSADTLYRIVSDHLGSVRLVVRVADGVVVQSRRYDAWGVGLEDTQPGWLPIGYAGGLEDVATKLVRFGARDYEPATGRWLAKDPIGFAGGDANLYSYVGNDPVDHIDPSGTIVDGVVDAVSLGISLMDYLCDPSAANAGWLGVDALAFAVPFVPGTGVVRAAAKGASRTAPLNLAEKLAMDEAKSGAGKQIMQGKIKDPMFPDAVWAKMRHVHSNPGGAQTVIHYWQNLQTGAREGFKFK